MNIGAGCHPNKVKVSGPGVAKSGLKAFEPTYFTVDCSEAGQGEDQESTKVEDRRVPQVQTGPAAPFWPDPEVPGLSRSSQAGGLELQLRAVC